MLNRLLKLLIVFFALIATFAPTAYAASSTALQQARRERANLRRETSAPAAAQCA